MDHTPRGRGYSQSTHYFHHEYVPCTPRPSTLSAAGILSSPSLLSRSNDYWDSDTGKCGPKSGSNSARSVHDLWLNRNGTEGPASAIANSCPWAGLGTEGMGPLNYNESYVIGSGCTRRRRWSHFARPFPVPIVILHISENGVRRNDYTAIM